MSDAPPKEGQPSSPSTDEGTAERLELPAWNRSRSKRTPAAEIVDAEPSEDAFERGVQQVGRSLFQRVRVIMLGLVVVAAAGAGYAALRESQAKSRAEATESLTEAAALAFRARVEVADDKDALKSTRFMPAIKDEADRAQRISQALASKSVADRPQAASLSHLVSAGLAMREQNAGRAEEETQKFLAAQGKQHPLRFVALEAQLAALEEQKKYDSAIALLPELLELAVAPDMVDLADRARWHEARMLVLAGKSDLALPKLEQLLKDITDGKRNPVYVPVAKSLLEQLRTGQTPLAWAKAQPKAEVPVVPTSDSTAADATN